MSAEDRRARLFGASFFDPDAPESFLYRFEELFNFATIPFYRRQVEPVEGRPDWATRDRLLDWLDEKAIQRKGHPLSWWIRYGLPDWMKKLSYRTLKEVVYRQVYETVTRYKSRIRIWDVINEAHDPIVKGNELNLDRDQVFEITELACRATRDADPDAVRIVNINRPWGDYRGEWEMMDPMHPIEYLEGLAERGIEYEVVGVQMYHGGPEHYVRDMTEQSALIDCYIRLGKPVHITEVQTPSSMEQDPGKWHGGEVASAGFWHRPWDPEVQADWVEQFYTIAVSKPQVRRDHLVEPERRRGPSGPTVGSSTARISPSRRITGCCVLSATSGGSSPGAHPCRRGRRLSMKATIPWHAWYGDTDLTLGFPDGWQVTVHEPAGAPEIGDAAIAEALDHPVGSPTLGEIVRGKRTVAIAVEDISRPCDAARILPALIARLESGGIRRENVRVVMSVGTHRPMILEDLNKKIGPAMVKTLEVHNSFPYGNVVDLGTTRRGTPVRICRWVAEADVKIGVGTITPHGGPGLGGGAKIVVPGVAGIDTIASIHQPGRLVTGHQQDRRQRAARGGRGDRPRPSASGLDRQRSHRRPPADHRHLCGRRCGSPSCRSPLCPQRLSDSHAAGLRWTRSSATPIPRTPTTFSGAMRSTS